MKPRLLLAIAVTALGLHAGQTGKIVGRVTDREAGEGLAAASVVVEGLDIGAAADAGGVYVVVNVPVGVYAVEGSMIGYRAVRMTDVLVEADRTTRVDFELEESAVEMPKVVVRAERPMVSKEIVGARYTVRAEQITFLPADRLVELTSFSTGVVRTESTFHVRGGRAQEVDYLIDGVSVVDPLTGEFGIELARGVADEVIFMPGGFTAEYGRAMSGVINLITVNPKPRFGAGYRLKSEEPMPFYYDFGYNDHSGQLHVPVLGNLRAVFNGSVTTIEDWDPRLFVLPHKNRADYSLYGKAAYDAGGQLKLTLSGMASRSRFDRYKSDWQLILDDYRSDLRHGTLGAAKLTWMPHSRAFYGLSLSRFHTDKTYGVREPGRFRFWEDFTFRDSSEYRVPEMDRDNPWGTPYERWWFFLTRGTYEEARRTATDVWTAKLAANSQVTNSHQIAAGLVGDFYQVESDWLRWPAWNAVRDSYRFRPNQFGAYIQDQIEFEGLYGNLGLRYDRFDPADSVQPEAVLPEQWDRVVPKQQLSPRVGASFRITEWLFARVNFGYYFQVPLFGQLYDNTVHPVYSRHAYGDSLFLVVGNPDLRPEQTRSYELGLQGELMTGVLATVNLWRKDVKDLIGTRTVAALPRSYITYVNVDFARLSGAELILDLRGDWYSAKLSYTNSSATGTSSYANEDYDEFLAEGDTSIPAVEYTLDFNQPHRAFAQLDIQPPKDATPWRTLNLVLEDAALHLLGYIGTGFPYTPPGGKGDPQTWNTVLGPTRSNVDLVLSKAVRVGPVRFDIIAEILNVLDIRDTMYVYPATGLPDDDGRPVSYLDFGGRFLRPDLPIRFGDPDYDSRRDYNHDGYVNQYEEYRSTYFYHRASIDWVNNFGPPRRARLGFNVSF